MKKATMRVVVRQKLAGTSTLKPVNEQAVVALYNTSQLITQREAVSMEIRKILTESVKNFNIVLDDASITSLSFGREFTNAFEAKQVAAQEVEHAKFITKFIVEKAEHDKKSDVIRAQLNFENLHELNFESKDILHDLNLESKDKGTQE
ncbi:hypothetical protein Cni_G29213 [Canna indica]|uniref:Prohibitin n=1 Tax=Canna indica TaxID=4628 RepID=A0AAQ3L7W8_9LILI|nr:hypothetical protein Cni_G29213 [Canna indica]